jgi:hypothetical protein
MPSQRANRRETDHEAEEGAQEREHKRHERRRKQQGWERGHARTVVDPEPFGDERSRSDRGDQPHPDAV